MASQDGPPVIPSAPAPRRRGRPGTWVMFVVVVLFAAAAAVACVAELTVPTDITPTPSMMIGTWKSTAGAELTLRPDGTFTARSLPKTFGGFVSWAPTQGSGVWHVVLTPPSGVALDFAGFKTEVELGLERAGSAVILYFDKGDPDQGVTGQYQFTKVGL